MSIPSLYILFIPTKLMDEILINIPFNSFHSISFSNPKNLSICQHPCSTYTICHSTIQTRFSELTQPTVIKFNRQKSKGTFSLKKYWCNTENFSITVKSLSIDLPVFSIIATKHHCPLLVRDKQVGSLQ